MKKAVKYLFVLNLVAITCIDASHQLIQALELAYRLPQGGAPKVVDQEIQRLLVEKADFNGVITVPVLQQNHIVEKDWPKGNVPNAIPELSWAAVKSQDRATCAYHALKNVILLMNAFEQNNSKFIKDLTSTSIFADFMSVWVPIVYQYRNYDGRIDWLLGTEIDRLTKDLQLLSTNQNLKDLDIKLNIVVTEDVRAVGVEAELPVNETMLMPIKKLAQQQDGMLGVVWTAGHGGHWVGFVILKKDGAQKMYYMNSINGSDPNFKQVVELFSMTVGAVDKLIQQNQKIAIKHELDRMEQDVDILQGKSVADVSIYPEFIGCVIRTGPMNAQFTKQNLVEAGFNSSADEYINIINAAWVSYLDAQAERAANPKAYEANLKVSKKRLYGFWKNQNNGTGFVLDLVSSNCDAFKQNYQHPMLKIDGEGNASIFDPAEKIDKIFTQFLVAFKDYDQAVFDQDIMRRIRNVLQQTLEFLHKNKPVYTAINWKEFGQGSTVKFSGFNEVIDAVLKRIKLLDGFNEQDFKNKYVHPLQNM